MWYNVNDFVNESINFLLQETIKNLPHCLVWIYVIYGSSQYKVFSKISALLIDHHFLKHLLVA